MTGNTNVALRAPQRPSRRISKAVESRYLLKQLANVATRVQFWRGCNLLGHAMVWNERDSKLDALLVFDWWPSLAFKIASLCEERSTVRWMSDLMERFLIARLFPRLPSNIIIMWHLFGFGSFVAKQEPNASRYLFIRQGATFADSKPTLKSHEEAKGSVSKMCFSCVYKMKLRPKKMECKKATKNKLDIYKRTYIKT